MVAGAVVVDRTLVDEGEDAWLAGFDIVTVIGYNHPRDATCAIDALEARCTFAVRLDSALWRIKHPASAVAGAFVAVLAGADA